MHKPRWMVLAIGMSLTLFAGCKVEDGTSTEKTLDDFASGTTAVGGNSCGAIEAPRNSVTPNILLDPAAAGSFVEPAKRLSQDTLRTYRSDIYRYFSGISQWHADYFVNKLNAQIILTNDDQYEAYCKTAQGLTEQREEAMSTCFVYETSGRFDARLAIIHRVTPGTQNEALNRARIRTGGVRAIGLVFAQFLARHEPSDDLTNKGVNVSFKNFDVDAEVSAYKKELTARFLADVVKSTKYSLDTFRPILGKELDDAKWDARRRMIGDAANKVGAAIDNGTNVAGIEILVKSGVSAADAQQFMDYVYAEAFDSAYCSDATLASAKTNFSRTMGAHSNGSFERLNNSVEKHSDRLADHFLSNSGGSDSALASATSFGLLQGGGCPCCNGQCATCNCANCQNGQCTCAGGSCNCTNCSQAQTTALQEQQMQRQQQMEQQLAAAQAAPSIDFSAVTAQLQADMARHQASLFAITEAWKKSLAV